MENIIDLQKLFHRSKTRILELGEVFTPEQFVEDMLDLLSKGKRGYWSNEDIIFFEPTCGHGNIVLPIYRRRLEAMFKKAQSSGIKNPHLYAIANAVNTLWAMDIDSENIEHTRSRVLWMTFEFLKEKLEIDSEITILQKNQKFFTHLMSALLWQIQENEALSALTTKGLAMSTKAGAKWLKDHGHKPVSFESTWVAYFNHCQNEGAIPLHFERAKKFIEGLLSGQVRGYGEFNFAKFLNPNSKVASSSMEDRALVAGA